MTRPTDSPRRHGRAPRLAEWLLRRVLPRDRQNESIRGDMLEEFRRRCASEPVRSSRLVAHGPTVWYWRETLSLITRAQGYTKMRMLDTLRQDARYAWRSCAKAPAFTLIVLTTLALGIGASTAIFSIVNGILLRPLPFRDAGRLLWINEVNPGGNPMSISWLNYLDWRGRAQSFEFLAASRTSSFTWTGTGAARRLAGRRVTSEFFPALGVEPTAGRTFATRDDLAGAEPVAIVTEAFWRSELGSDPSALGRPLTLDGRAFTIVGILPPGFHYLRDYDVFVAMGPFAGDRPLLERGNHAGYFALGRLKAGVTPDAAAREMQSIERQLSQQYPDTNAGISVRVEPLSSRIVTDVRQTLLVLLGAVGLLLLIACVNVSNLLVARGAARQHELAVRAALGGGPTRLAVQLLTESTLLSAAGGLLGVLLAAGLLRALIAVAPEGTPRLDEVRLDAAALWFALGAVTVCGLLFGAFPAAQASSVSGQQALTRTRAAGASARSHRLRRGLLVAEVALALVLLTGAGLMIRTLRGLSTLDPGFRPDHVLTLQLSAPGHGWDDARRAALGSEIVARTRALPGVTAAAVVSALPIDGSDWNSVFAIQDKPSPARHDLLPSSAFTLISPGYFDAMGTPLVRGRLFTDADRAGSAPVVIINEALARRMWPGESPIGKRLKQGWPEMAGTWREVVGVATDVKFEGIAEPTPMQVYMPFPQDPPADFAIVVRTTSDPASLGAAVEAAVHAINRDLAVFSIRTMTHVMEASIARQRMAEIVLAVFAAVALTLASLGLYGLVAHSVTERTHEIGVRMALGAAREDVLSLVVRHGLSMALLGTVLGLAGAAALSRSLEGLLFAVDPMDPVTFAAVCALLLVVATVACCVPAIRATRIAPTTALRLD